MKKFLSFWVMALPLASQAQSLVFHKTLPDLSNAERSAHVRFMVNDRNPELGRAWLQVFYSQPVFSDTDDALAPSTDVAVPNLSYDPVHKRILFKKSNGESVVCATAVERGALRDISYNETGECRLSLTPALSNRDDGFYVHSEKSLSLALNL